MRREVMLRAKDATVCCHVVAHGKVAEREDTELDGLLWLSSAQHVVNAHLHTASGGVGCRRCDERLKALILGRQSRGRSTVRRVTHLLQAQQQEGARSCARTQGMYSVSSMQRGQ